MVEFDDVVFSREAAVVWAVGRFPGSSLSRLSRVLGFNYLTLRGCVKRLCRAGFLRAEVRGRSFRIFLTGEGRMLLKRINAALSAVNDNDNGLKAIFKISLPIRLGGLFNAPVRIMMGPKPSDYKRISAAALRFLSELLEDEGFLSAAARERRIQVNIGIDLSGAGIPPGQLEGILAAAVREGLKSVEGQPS
ncbi:MAG: MarR family winged helix-turn-helix transcriptional regulator [Nitrososphaerota archaeon]